MRRKLIVKRMGRRPAELNAVEWAYVDLLARATTKMAELDGGLSDTGFVNAEGEPRAGMTLYASLLNTASRTVERLDEHMRRKSSPEDELAGYIAGAYPGNGDASE